MREPSLRTSRLAIAGALIAAAVVGGAGFFLGRTISPKPSSSESATVEAPAPRPSPMVEVERVLTRKDFVELASLAADALAAGSAVPPRVHDAIGRRFELAIPFGCSGAAEEGSQAPLRWRYDEEKEVLRLHAAVTLWETSDWELGDAADQEAIEGFWLAREWSSSAECPPRPTGGGTPAAGPAAPPEPTLAVAQFFSGDVRREALRDGRPFETVKAIPKGEFAAPRGFRVMLSGRIGQVPRASGRGEPVQCIQPGGIEQRPRCIVAVTLDEVRIENPASGEVLASWPIGRD